MLARRMILACLLVLGATGCGFGGGPTVRVVSVVSAPPAEVKVVVAVQDADSAVNYLEASSFAIQENDVELDPVSHAMSLGTPDEVNSEVVVLLDTSASGELRANLESGTRQLLEKLLPHARVTLFGYGGAEEPALLGEFENKSVAPEALFPRDLAKDNARNLNGAILRGIARLKDGKRRNRLYNGALVVIAAGPDTAGRVSSETLWKNESLEEFAVFGARPEGADIESFAIVRAPMEFTQEDATMRLFDLGLRVRNYFTSTYLLRYCSSARSGTRRVAVRVHYEADDGSARSGFGRAKDDFDASQFRAGCMEAEEADRAGDTSPIGTSLDLDEDRPSPEPNDGVEEGDAPPAPAKAPPAKAERGNPSPAPPTRAPSPPRSGVKKKPDIVAPPSGDGYR
jgi:hypothetical protein